MIKESSEMVEYVLQLHHRSPRVVLLKIGLQYGSPKVVTLLEIGFHHRSLRMVELEVEPYQGCSNCDQKVF